MSHDLRTMHEYKGWSELYDPAPIEWKPLIGLQECHINGRLVAFMENRPYYCDRGSVRVLCELPDIDHQDGFPRYYMSEEVGKSETEAFLRWRLWRQRDKPQGHRAMAQP